LQIDRRCPDAERFDGNTQPSCLASHVLQNFKDSPTHRNKSSPFCGLAVWHKDHAVLPIEVLDTHLEEFSFVPHSCVAHQDDDVPEKCSSSWVPVASQGSRYQFPFRLIVKPKVSSMLFHHLTFGAWAITSTPPLCAAFVAMFAKRSWHLRRSQESAIAQRNHL
jgi:hypothetical protein